MKVGKISIWHGEQLYSIFVVLLLKRMRCTSTNTLVFQLLKIKNRQIKKLKKLVCESPEDEIRLI